MKVSLAETQKIAKNFIRPYVVRGDSYEHLKEGCMGSYNRDFAAVIGSAPIPNCPGRPKYGADSLRVLRVGDTCVCHTFSLRELYDEIRNGVEQATLF